MSYTLKAIFREPYRLFFLGGSLTALVNLSLWFIYSHQLLSGSEQFLFSYPAGLFHLLGMLFGTLGFYLGGFLLTAFPKWVNSPPFKISEFVLLFSLLALAQILGMAGFFYSPLCVKSGFILAGLFQFTLLYFLLRKFLSTRHENKNMQPVFVLLSLGFGALSLILANLYLFYPQHFLLYALSIQIAATLYLLLLILSVTSRIVPFFSSRVLPFEKFSLERNFLPSCLILLILFTFAQTPLLEHFTALKITLSLLLLWVIGRQWMAWKPLKTFSVPLLFIIHVCLCWILIYFILHTLVLFFFPQNFMLHISLLHALFIGCDLSLVLAISTRVTRGHGGYPLLLDWPAGIAFALLQVSAFSRVFLPLAANYSPHFALYTHYSALLGLVAFMIWGFRYGPLLFSSKQ